jgi:hypothetical protein
VQSTNAYASACGARAAAFARSPVTLCPVLLEPGSRKTSNAYNAVPSITTTASPSRTTARSARFHSRAKKAAILKSSVKLPGEAVANGKFHLAGDSKVSEFPAFDWWVKERQQWPGRVRGADGRQRWDKSQ